MNIGNPTRATGTTCDWLHGFELMTPEDNMLLTRDPPAPSIGRASSGAATAWTSAALGFFAFPRPFLPAGRGSTGAAGAALGPAPSSSEAAARSTTAGAAAAPLACKTHKRPDVPRRCAQKEAGPCVRGYQPCAVEPSQIVDEWRLAKILQDLRSHACFCHTAGFNLSVNQGIFTVYLSLSEDYEGIGA